MKRRFLALLLTVLMATTAFGGYVYADEQTDATNETKNLSYDGYDMKWSDEFDGDSLNRNDWNVELHEPGWVNSELQEYVDSPDNISVKDGKLVISPKKNISVVETGSNILKNATFSSGMDSWTETIANWGGEYVTDATRTTSNGTITYDIKNPGTDNWHVQLKQSVALEAGKTYVVSFKVNSTVARTFKTGVMSTTYAWYGGADPVINEGDNDISFEFTMNTTDPAADFYISLGQCGETAPGVITISDLVLIDKENVGTVQKQEVVSYTSGRISTQNKETFTYGLFEVSAKVPAGQGYLPAFWLMANDENIYGQWPRCGEIDCMEVMGQDTTTAYGTIHYGNPHRESQGTYKVSGDNSYSSEFHKFSCEWEPGVIRWYVDGVLYHEESDWFSTTEGQGTLSYPAPFDQPFYIILNLAVGGSWVGNPDDSTSFENNNYEIDYVRVYQKSEYDENVKRPDKKITLRDPDSNGNYINNGDFSEKEDLTDDKNWKFLTALGGDATATINNNEILIETKDEGTVDYSVQLVQADLPFEKGATYEVKFDAYASAARNIGVDIKAPDLGYSKYMPSQTASLTTEKQTYTYTFVMKDASDKNGRLEYNMGAKGSTADIHISNVSVKKIADADPNAVEKKTVLANGNYVYNGRFQEGTAHLGDWEVNSTGKASYAVTSFVDNRRFLATMAKKEAVTLTQKDLAITSGSPYQFSMDIQAEKTGTVDVVIGGKTYAVKVEAGDKANTYKLNLDSSVKFKNSDLVIKLKGENKIFLDNVSITEAALLKNGSFNDNMTGFVFYADSSASATAGVDSLKNDNSLEITINNTSDQDWKVQLKQENIPLEKGKTYKLTLKAKSTLPRSMRFIMQGQEARGWDVYSTNNVVALTSEFQTFTDTFVMEKDTDLQAFFSVCLGNVDEVISTTHVVTIDDISLEEVGTAAESSPVKKPASVNPAPSQSASPSTPASPADKKEDKAANTSTKKTPKKASEDKKAEDSEDAEEASEETEVAEEEPVEEATEEAVEAAEEEVPLAAEDEEASTEKEANFIVRFFRAIINFFRKLFHIA